ncbi:Short-chain dehydrogenase/reductase SDR [Nitrosotalea sinensis]|uniref:Short-chain dehydrogenase/reductase SDR n=1 Tax=Nitrosotalea sinensis TaxID=1499975 RepID=A0A2H1EF63_9ARCH|nr:SDR family oxidoreductase [Candidatus Nitrosotalea sinensis]SHO43364.1 Short-chain dehydrogenase/reductase SDR [Candidatus Nitrosotalea sinensis]
MNYNKKVVVITGASSGIGEQSAEKFAQLHAIVILVSRNEEKLQQISSRLSKYQTTILVYACDISKKDQVDKMAKFVIEKFGSVDVLVNNAGFGIYDTVEKIKVEEMESQMSTNFFGMMYCIKAFLPKMLEKRSGHIVNVASVAGSVGIPGMASYCASKFAMLGFSESLYHELKGTGVGITVVSPIMVRTNFFDHVSFGKMPRYSSTSLDPKTVANAIIKASSSPRLEIVVPQFVRFVIWLKQTLPYIINPIIGGIFRRSLKSKI